MESKRYKIKVIGHTKIETHTEYTISIEKKEVNFIFSERYKILKLLNDSMKNCTKNNTFPKFPPKKLFGKEDEKFILKREKELNDYFEIISNHPEFSNLPPLIKFIEEKKEKYFQINKTNNSKETNDINKAKKENEKKPEKDLKNNLKKADIDYANVVKKFSLKFFDMNTYYDKDMINDNDLYVKYFENNKIDISIDSNTTSLDSGNENNFSYINKNDNILESIENQIKGKMESISDLYKSFDEVYEAKEIIVQI